MKGVGRIYQQTFIDTYAKVAFAKLYDRKTPITAAESQVTQTRPVARQPFRIERPPKFVSLASKHAPEGRSG
jgi:hypothetical protein